MLQTPYVPGAGVQQPMFLEDDTVPRVRRPFRRHDRATGRVQCARACLRDPGGDGLRLAAA